MSAYPDCHDCKRPMRNSRQKTADHPGTVSYSSAGLCQGCVRRRKRTNQPITKNQPKTTVDVIATHRSLTAYLEWRRPFREKAGISNGN